MEEDLKHFFINIKNIHEEESKFQFKKYFFFPGTKNLKEIKKSIPVNIKCLLKKVGDGFHLRGYVDALINVECSRCLNLFNLAVQSHYVSTYFPATEKKTDKKGENGQNQGEDDIYFFSDDTIDILPKARDQILLSMPMKPICKKSCLGLCGTCGKNLNFENCDCSTSSFNQGFAVLKNFKPD